MIQQLKDKKSNKFDYDAVDYDELIQTSAKGIQKAEQKTSKIQQLRLKNLEKAQNEKLMKLKPKGLDIINEDELEDDEATRRDIDPAEIAEAMKEYTIDKRKRQEEENMFGFRLDEEPNFESELAESIHENQSELDFQEL